MRDRELLQLNRRGIFPGPEEDEEAFFLRAARLKSQAEVVEVPLFDIALDWVPIVYSNLSLAPWEGAATWIGEEEITIQLRKSFLPKFYSQKELLIHEMVHAARSAFAEPKFEEFFAYKTSFKKWRSIWGPLFQVPWEAYLFIGALPFSLLGGLGSLPLLGVISFLLVRLGARHRCLNRCARHLERILKNKKDLFAFMLRLTDQEILFFSQASQEEAIDYIASHRNTSLRWRVITLAYPLTL